MSRKRACILLGATLVVVGTALVFGLGRITANAASEPSIVWLEQGAGNPAWTEQHNAAAEAGRRLGYTFKAVSGNLNPTDQANILKQLVDQKPSAIILNAIDRNRCFRRLHTRSRRGFPCCRCTRIFRRRQPA